MLNLLYNFAHKESWGVRCDLWQQWNTESFVESEICLFCHMVCPFVYHWNLSPVVYSWIWRKKPMEYINNPPYGFILDVLLQHQNNSTTSANASLLITSSVASCYLAQSCLQLSSAPMLEMEPGYLALLLLFLFCSTFDTRNCGVSDLPVTTFATLRCACPVSPNIHPASLHLLTAGRP